MCYSTHAHTHTHTLPSHLVFWPGSREPRRLACEPVQEGEGLWERRRSVLGSKRAPAVATGQGWIDWPPSTVSGNSTHNLGHAGKPASLIFARTQRYCTVHVRQTVSKLPDISRLMERAPSSEARLVARSGYFSHAAKMAAAHTAY